jgi:hypothetical protein
MSDLEWHENKKLRRMEVAAPRMLEALKALAEEFVWMDDAPNGGYAPSHPIVEARAAIKAATGEP